MKIFPLIIVLCLAIPAIADDAALKAENERLQLEVAALKLQLAKLQEEIDRLKGVTPKKVDSKDYKTLTEFIDEFKDVMPDKPAALSSYTNIIQDTMKEKGKTLKGNTITLTGIVSDGPGIKGQTTMKKYWIGISPKDGKIVEQIGYGTKYKTISRLGTIWTWRAVALASTDQVEFMSKLKVGDTVKVKGTIEVVSFHYLQMDGKKDIGMPYIVFDISDAVVSK